MMEKQTTDLDRAVDAMLARLTPEQRHKIRRDNLEAIAAHERGESIPLEEVLARLSAKQIAKDAATR